MITIIRNILVLILATIIIIASGGFNIYQSNCACDENPTNTITLTEQYCQLENEVTSCCANEIVSEPLCCTEKKIATDLINSNCNAQDNCCSSESTFFKTDIFDFPSTSHKSFEFIIAFVSVLNFSQKVDVQFIFSEVNYSFDLPPPKYGKQLLFEINQLKLDSFLA